MSAPKSDFEFFELCPGSPPDLIIAAARTICDAFSNDPLITWLRPDRNGWCSTDPKVLTWQVRRVRQNMVDGRVFALRNRSEEAEKGKPLVLAAVAFVMEPFTFKHWLLRLVPRFRLWVSNITKPVHDGSDDERTTHMLVIHDSMLESMEKRFRQPVTYIEVIAVDPALQGKGVGSMVVQEILALAPARVPVVLESTSRRSVPFYQRFGFKEIGSAVLTPQRAMSAPDECTLWFMAKD
ncbi:acetyltransferase (GNAT) family domain-containing protein [Purpureocillium lilacinum]|uniref:Acetyltransferase (GNAT) family domain-containing protein n=1 Tax=Purpureocillium lilacinum TaxID=33203 RepID=A0A179HBR5_PURLI|nr:acetyltransferase (GNAT) family domain-containing protein [Purpureocillium lilacinum]